MYANALETVTISPMDEMTRTLELNEGDSVEVGISANPALGTFVIINPEQEFVSYPTELAPYGEGARVSFSFSADVSGSYVLRFWNNDTVRSTEVTLDYTIHYSFSGLMQNYGLLILVLLSFSGLGAALFFYSRAKRRALKVTTNLFLFFCKSFNQLSPFQETFNLISLFVKYIRSAKGAWTPRIVQLY